MSFKLNLNLITLAIMTDWPCVLGIYKKKLFTLFFLSFTLLKCLWFISQDKI